ncbi:hypothetical protein [Caulobacter sp. 1776]|uniref:hypothetical protein n=1 Tax=Caulobacter sp. 1776 TaxID=3156420 RepID=UPI003399D297
MALSILMGLALALRAPSTAPPMPCAPVAFTADAAPGAPGFRLSNHPGAVGDLPYVEARSRASGAVVRVYYDKGLEAAARSGAACLGPMLDRLREVVPEDRQGLHWSALVLSAHEDYRPPRDNPEARWSTPMRNGGWDAPTLDFLLRVLPHEETHFSQHRPGAPPLARWFEEGHAEWAGLHVTEQFRPELAKARRAHLADARASEGPVKLGKWGGMAIKPEALDRQLSPQDHARRAADPSFVPKGPFRFGPDDFYKDEVASEARYGAALAIFEGLEQRHGRVAVQAWILAVLAAAPGVSAADLCKTMLGEDISGLLN